MKILKKIGTFIASYFSLAMPQITQAQLDAKSPSPTPFPTIDETVAEGATFIRSSFNQAVAALDAKAALDDVHGGVTIEEVPGTVVAPPCEAKFSEPTPPAKKVAKKREVHIDLDAAAALLGLSVSTFRSYRSKGLLTLNSIRKDGRVVFSHAEVRAEAKRRATKG